VDKGARDDKAVKDLVTVELEQEKDLKYNLV